MRKHLITRLVAGLLFAAGIIVLIVGIVSAGLIGSSNAWGPGSRAWLITPIAIITVFNAALLLVFGTALFFLTRIETNLENARRVARQGRPRPRAAMPAPAPSTPSWLRTPVETAAPSEAAAAAVATAAAATEAARTESAPTEPSNGKLATTADAAATAADAAVAAGAAATAAAAAAGAEAAAQTAEEARAMAEDALAAGPVADAAEALPGVTEPPTAATELPGVQVFEEPAPAESEEAADTPPVKLPGVEEAARIAKEMAARKPDNPDAPAAGGAPDEDASS